MGKGGGPKAMKAPVGTLARLARRKEQEEQAGATGAAVAEKTAAEKAAAEKAAAEKAAAEKAAAEKAAAEKAAAEKAAAEKAAAEKAAEALAAVDSMRRAVTDLQVRTSAINMCNHIMIASGSMQAAVDALKLVVQSAENVSTVKHVNAALTAMNSVVLVMTEVMRTANALNKLTFEQSAAGPAAGPAAGCKRPSEMASTAGSAGAEKGTAGPPRRRRK